MKRRSFVENSVPSTDNTEAPILTDCPTAITAVPSPRETGEVLYHITACVTEDEVVHMHAKDYNPGNGIATRGGGGGVMA